MGQGGMGIGWGWDEDGNGEGTGWQARQHRTWHLGIQLKLGCIAFWRQTVHGQTLSASLWSAGVPEIQSEQNPSAGEGQNEKVGTNTLRAE